jgi:hypothetical protein
MSRWHGHCCPRDLEKIGFTRNEIAEAWAFASALAGVEGADRLFARTAAIVTARPCPEPRLRMEKPGQLAGSAPLFPFNPG